MILQRCAQYNNAQAFLFRFGKLMCVSGTGGEKQKKNNYEEEFNCWPH